LTHFEALLYYKIDEEPVFCLFWATLYSW